LSRKKDRDCTLSSLSFFLSVGNVFYLISKNVLKNMHHTNADFCLADSEPNFGAEMIGTLNGAAGLRLVCIKSRCDFRVQFTSTPWCAKNKRPATGRSFVFGAPWRTRTELRRRDDWYAERKSNLYSLLFFAVLMEAIKILRIVPH
jgi:hypothetical protein